MSPTRLLPPRQCRRDQVPQTSLPPRRRGSTTGLAKDVVHAAKPSTYPCDMPVVGDLGRCASGFTRFVLPSGPQPHSSSARVGSFMFDKPGVRTAIAVGTVLLTLAMP